MSERARLAFVVESGTDVRLVEGLGARFALTVLARRIPGGAEVSHAPRVPASVIVGPPGRLTFARWARARLRASPPDRVLVQGYGLAALAANLVGRRGSPTFMLVCSPAEAYYRCRRAATVPEKPHRPWGAAGLSLLARANARIGRHYVVLSDYLGGVVRRHGGGLPVSVIPVYGVDTTRFAPSPRPRADLKRALGLAPERPLLFFSSRIAPEKDADALLGAMRRLRERGLLVHVLHRSGGSDAFQHAARRYDLGGQCTATDAVHPDALPADYQAADLCVQASRAEGLGFSPLEAMACGTPVVAAAVGGLRETVIAGDTGWTYPPGDAGALADAIGDALADPAEGARRAARGRRLVQERFEREMVFDRLEALLT